MNWAKATGKGGEKDNDKFWVGEEHDALKQWMKQRPEAYVIFNIQDAYIHQFDLSCDSQVVINHFNCAGKKQASLLSLVQHEGTR